MFGGGGGQSAAQQQLDMIRQQQAQHDNAVRQDIGAVDKAFSPFDDNYYSGFTKSYTNAMNPQLDNQYAGAKSKQTALLAATDRDQGSTGAAADANLYRTYGNARAQIGNQAVDATNNLRGTVNNAKNNLYGLAEQATDPLSMATQAQATAGSIVAPQSYPGLGNVFGDVLSPLAAGIRTNQQGYNQQGGGGSNLGPAPLSSPGSGIFS